MCFFPPQQLPKFCRFPFTSRLRGTKCGCNILCKDVQYPAGIETRTSSMRIKIRQQYTTVLLPVFFVGNYLYDILQYGNAEMRSLRHIFFFFYQNATSSLGEHAANFIPHYSYRNHRLLSSPSKVQSYVSSTSPRQSSTSNYTKSL